MHAYQVTRFDAPPQIHQVDIPLPASGEVAVSVAACGLNFADLLMAGGKYQERPTLPFTLGMELSGTITAVGPDVANLATGDRVAVFSGHGGLAEVGVFPADRCTRIPDEMPFDHAAAFQIAYGTAHVALDHRAGLHSGETLLVLGAAGGVGLAAVEIGKLMGARVIACARGAAKLDIARAAGADHVVDSDSDDLRGALKAMGGVDVVFDPVGGDPFRAALSACNPEARIVVVGFASGDIPQVPANRLLVKNVTLIGHYWGGYMAFRPDVLTESLNRLYNWYGEGRLHPHISATYPLAQSGEAMEFLRARRSTGKVVVTMA